LCKCQKIWTSYTLWLLTLTCTNTGWDSF
jgi:hypothetical protein